MDDQALTGPEKTTAASGEAHRQKLKDIDTVEDLRFEGLKREHWWQLWRPRHSPPPPKASLEDAETIPLATASLLSKLTFHWVTPIMIKGYQRPLQATDLWKLDSSRESDELSRRFLKSLEERQRKAKEWNDLLSTAVPTKKQRARWALTAATRRSLKDTYEKFGSDKSYSERRRTLEEEWRQQSGRRQGSLTWALNDTLPGFWYAGAFKVVSDISQLMSPLLMKALINFSKEVYAANQNGTEQPNIGRGVGMTIGLFCLTIMQSVCQHQFFFRSMSYGVLSRGALITSVYKKALSLSVGSKAEHPNGKLLTYLSSDISRIDYCAAWFHAIWTAPIQLIITLVLLIIQIGPSAIVGFLLFIVLTPLQTFFMKYSFLVRRKSMHWTDSRSRLLRELLSSMEIIKYFTYEKPFLKRLKRFRYEEMVGIRKIQIVRAANQAIAFSVPALASVLAFVTYASTHDTLDPALIFTSLAFFNSLRQPLMFLPRALSSLTDAQNAIERLTKIFEAETRSEDTLIDPTLGPALKVHEASFCWSASPNSMPDEGLKSNAPFKIPTLNIEVPRGAIIAITGPVGSGKSSLLQGFIGEMPLLSGTVTFGGRIAYCQQTAWIQNASVRENIIFGHGWDEDRYWTAVENASLMTDLELLADGDLTEIGEKGVNLSGGQKQRVNIARALYHDADIVLFDDPLSAVDAHVGKALFDNAILPLRKMGKSVVLVTHALHFLPMVDYIYTMRSGQIIEQGSYLNLMQSNGYFSTMMGDFGGCADQEDEDVETQIDEGEAPKHESLEVKVRAIAQKGSAKGTGKLEGRLMVSETRKTGSVGAKVYSQYLRAGRFLVTIPILIVSAVLMQGSQVLSTVWLTWWQNLDFGLSWSVYQGGYAAFAVCQAIFTFAVGGVLGVIANLASKNLHSAALENVFYCPKSVFDTQPLGRILGVFGKDFDTIDNQLADSLRMMVLTLSTLIGSVIIITIYLHYFIVIIFFVGVGYWYFAAYYRTSSREVKRLDSLLRSVLYSHFSESLSGIATIRAYGDIDRFIKDNAYYMDLQNRAYLLTVTNQRWLAIRLDFLGSFLVFAVSIMCAKGGGGLTASEIALCLTYLTTITTVLGMVTRQSAEVENNMNAVERVIWYSDKKSLPQEHPHEVLSTQPDDLWPSTGTLEFDNVEMAYRPGLPLVLKGISFKVNGGEKVGIIGRTGAGKTSITLALFRLIEASSGQIKIDDQDISKIGLNSLRSKIAIIPQDPVLFSGTLRTNLDPFKQHDDAKLYDALHRAQVTGSRVDEKAEAGHHFILDTVVEEEGSNLSVGERSLISLARALIKDAQIVVLDEATAAVDLETDAKIQKTIHSEFQSKTLLCIAHRLRTIISWDKIIVMNAGEIEQYDTPIKLYDSGGLFRSLCEKSNITREDIIKFRQDGWVG